MRDSTKVTLVMIAITGAFLFVGKGDFEEAVAQEHDQKTRREAVLARCMPGPGEVLIAEWDRGQLVCQTHVGKYGTVPRVTGCNLVSM